MASQKEVIEAFMKSLDKTSASGVNALNEAVKACSKFKSLQSVINQLINDCKSATIVDEFLQEKCGIILNNEDTGAITGSDAGGSKIKTVENVVPETGKASYPSGTSFTKRGLKVIVPKKSSLTKTERIVVQGLYSWWIDEALKLIEESYGYSFTDNDVTVKEMTLEFIDDLYSDVMAYVTPGLYATNGVAYNAGKLTLTVNIDRFKNITAKDINGSKETYPFYLDRLLAHELTHAIMAAKVNNFSDLPKFIAEGIAELTHGADDIRTSEIENLASNPSQLENILKGDNSYPYLDYAAGYIFLRYLAQQVSEGNDTIPVDPNANEFIENTLDDEIIQTQNGNDTINNSGSQVTISSGNGKDIITNYGSNVSINLGKGNDDIYNFGNIVKIDGGAGNDYIGNFASNATINGGAGHDYIVNNSRAILISSGSGNDYIFNNAFGSIVTVDSGSGNDTIENNYGSVQTINAGNGNDYVYNNGIAGYINLGAGNDTIVNGADNVNGGKGDDLIQFNEHSTNSEINYTKGDGNDTIYGYNLTDTISLTKGSITGSVISGSDLVLNIGKGSIRFVDALTVNVNGKIINPTPQGTKGKDTINNVDSNVAINGYGGNDKITNVGENVSINAGNGNNFIENYGEGSIIHTGNGKNTIYNRSHTVKIISGSGSDSINTWNSVVDSGAGNDTIINTGGSLIMSGAGNDVISDKGYYTTINGGKGNDTIYGHGYLNPGVFVTGDYPTIEYSTGDGNDVVYGYTSGDTIKIFGQYTTSTVGSDILIKVGKGSIRLKDAKDETLNIVGTKTLLKKGTKRDDNIENIFANATINALGGEDTVKNFGHDVSINSGDGNDYIDNTASNVTIESGNGDDYINNNGGEYTTVNAGAGNDSVNNAASKASINCGTGDDHVTNWSSHVTIDGGNGNDYICNRSDSSNVLIRGDKGDDTIHNDLGSNFSIEGGDGNDHIDNSSGLNVTIAGGKGNDYVSDDGIGTTYVYTDGNDTLEGFNETSTLVLGSVKVNSSVRSDDTVNLKLSNKKTLTLENYGVKKINLVESISDVKKVNVIPQNHEDSVVINGTEQNDYFDNYGNNVTIKGDKGNDYVQDSYYSSNADGIGTVYVYSGGNDTVENFNELDTIVLGSVKVNSSVRSGYRTITLNLSNKKTLTLIGYESDKVNIVKSLSDVEKFNIIDNNVDSTVISDTDQNDYVSNWGRDVTIKGGKGNDYVYGEHTHFGTVYVYSAGDDTLAYFNESDTIVLGSIKVNSSIRSDAGTVTLKLSNKKTLTLERYWADKVNIVKSVNSEKNLIANDRSYVTVKGTKQDDIIYSIGNNMTIDGGDGNDDIFIEEYRNNSTFYTCDNVSINSGKGNDYVSNPASSNVTIDGGKGDDYIYNGGDNVSINGGAGNDSIENDRENVSIIGGNGNDCIIGGRLINAGSGNDTINYGGENVSVLGGKGNDYIRSMDGASCSNISINGGDGDDYIDNMDDKVTILGGAGNDTVDNWGNADKVTIDGGKGDDSLSGGNRSDKIYGGSGKDTLHGKAGNDKLLGNKGNDLIYGDNGNDSISGGDGKDTLHGKAGNDKLLGNKGNDLIYGGNGNDSLWGGAGNDSLWGGSGKDNFIYKPGEGTDKIFDYQSGDMLTILNKNGKAGGTFSKATFSGDELTLEITGGGTVIFDGVNAGSKININSKTYTIKGKTLK